VRCEPLHVEQRVLNVVEHATEVHQSGLGGVGRVMEHRLACEEGSDGHAVETADEVIV